MQTVTSFPVVPPPGQETLDALVAQTHETEGTRSSPGRVIPASGHGADSPRWRDATTTTPAAERLRDQPAWRTARTVKANPDSPQWPVRQRAVEDGKVVYMAVPRLAEEDPFFLLDPDDLADTPRKASSIKGASRSARTVAIAELGPVDLVVAGCVAVDETGARLGKGGGFSDLEFALAWEAGLIGEHTVVATTVHDLQVREPGEIPMTDHDVRLDLIVTPDQVIECPRRGPRRPEIRWEELTEAKIDAIPLLRALQPENP